jgi:hypothetical protein
VLEIANQNQSLQLSLEYRDECIASMDDFIHFQQKLFFLDRQVQGRRNHVHQRLEVKLGHQLGSPILSSSGELGESREQPANVISPANDVGGLIIGILVCKRLDFCKPIGRVLDFAD